MYNAKVVTEEERNLDMTTGMCVYTSVEDDLTKLPKKDEVVCGLFSGFSDLPKYGEIIWRGYKHWKEEQESLRLVTVIRGLVTLLT